LWQQTVETAIEYLFNLQRFWDQALGGEGIGQALLQGDDRRVDGHIAQVLVIRKAILPNLT